MGSKILNRKFVIRKSKIYTIINIVLKTINKKWNFAD